MCEMQMVFAVSSGSVRRSSRVAGVAVRHAYFLAGTVLFCVLAAAIANDWHGALQSRPALAQPQFQLADPSLARLPIKRQALQFSDASREMIQYGRLEDRDIDLTFVATIPAVGRDFPQTDFASEISQLQPIAHGVPVAPRVFYDIETRFGPVRASRFNIYADGFVKPCLSFLSRFDGAALQYKGWYCEASGKVANANWLACALDRLQASGSLPTPQAEAYFARRAPMSPRCDATPVSQTYDPAPRAPLRRI